VACLLRDHGKYDQAVLQEIAIVMPTRGLPAEEGLDGESFHLFLIPDCKYCCRPKIKTIGEMPACSHFATVIAHYFTLLHIYAIFFSRKVTFNINSSLEKQFNEKISEDHRNRIELYEIFHFFVAFVDRVC
jgi:hypothetical protein